SAGSEERRRLEETLREAGKWEEVCTLNPIRVGSLVSAEEVEEETRARLRELLSWEESVTLRIRKLPDQAGT
ncbi:MAG: hypothetical protein QME89_08435, partial [Actinomycetota bacterium]|nr:hypothetical protein [Actinomycetota bacterium]